MATSSTTRRRRISQYLGAAAILSTLITLVLFIVYTISTSSQNSVFSVICIITTALTVVSLLSIGIYSFPLTEQLHRFRIVGTVPSLVSSVTATGALAWMTIEREQLPERILGAPATPLLVLGFITLVLTAITQAFFWATIVMASRPETLPTHIRKPSRRIEISFPPPAYKSPIHSRHSSLISAVLSRKSKDSNYPPSTVSPLSTPPRTPPKPEINHFDAWTPDSTTASSVTASLRQIALETQEEEDGAFGLGLQVDSPRLPEHDVLESPVVSRARNFTFPGPGQGGCWSADPRVGRFPGSPLGHTLGARPGSAGMI